MSELSPNMTEKHLQAVIDTLPDQMDDAELCALTLTIYSVYRDDAAEVISSLISTIYAYGRTRGLDSRVVSMKLRRMADPRTAPEFVFLDPDLPVSEWEKQYSMDVIYVRADRIEALTAKLAKAVEALGLIVVDNTWGLEHKTYMKCRATLAEIKGESHE